MGTVYSTNRPLKITSKNLRALGNSPDDWYGKKSGNRGSKPKSGGKRKVCETLFSTDTHTNKVANMKLQLRSPTMMSIRLSRCKDDH